MITLALSLLGMIGAYALGAWQTFNDLKQLRVVRQNFVKIKNEK